MAVLSNIGRIWVAKCITIYGKPFSIIAVALTRDNSVRTIELFFNIIIIIIIK